MSISTPSVDVIVEAGHRADGGILKDTAGLQPSSGFRVRLSGGKLKVSDGPFTEAKELVGGYAIVEVPSREKALEVARKFMDLHRVHWPAFEGESECRRWRSISQASPKRQPEGERGRSHHRSASFLFSPRAISVTRL